MARDRHTLEEAARLLLGPEFKRPLAKLLGPHHPDGPRKTLDPRLPFRWMADPVTADGQPNPQARPIPWWVWPVIAQLLAERADELSFQASDARHLAERLRRGE